MLSGLLLLQLGGLPAALGRVDPGNGVSSSCEDILRFAFPDLCRLQMVQENITVRGLRLAYWRYSAVGGGRSEPDRLPVLVVHGGPAFGHSYTLPLKQQACRGHEVVFYDQVGCGMSSTPSHPRQTAPWLFTIDYYVEEAQALVAALGWTAFHLVGHSWGTIVGQAYGLQQDPRLRGIVLAGPISDAQLYIRSQWDRQLGSLGTLPLYTQHLMRRLDALRAYSSPLYAAEDAALTSFFTTRTVPPPDCFLASTGGLGREVPKEIYVGMQGASEFTIGGVLANLNMTGSLHRITNPVLLIRGTFDTMRAPTVDALREHLPRAWTAVMPRSGHCTMLDDPLLTNDVVGEFLGAAESGELRGLQARIDEAVAGPDGALPASALAGAAPRLPSWLVPAAVQGLLLSLAVAFGVLAGPHLAPRYYARMLWAQNARADLMICLDK